MHLTNILVSKDVTLLIELLFIAVGFVKRPPSWSTRKGWLHDSRGWPLNKDVLYCTQFFERVF